MNRARELDVNESSWVDWSPGDDTVCLDGRFTIEELRNIIEAMQEEQ